jgi:hypothetical protein
VYTRTLSEELVMAKLKRYSGGVKNNLSSSQAKAAKVMPNQPGGGQNPRVAEQGLQSIVQGRPNRPPSTSGPMRSKPGAAKEVNRGGPSVNPPTSANKPPKAK